MTPVVTPIIRAVAEALCRVVADSYLTYSSTNQVQDLDIISSGTYSGTLPRRFLLEIISANQIRITEDTVLKDFTPIAPYTVTVISGTPFVITGTGISVTATFDRSGILEVGDTFLLRVGKCSTTVREAAQWPRVRASIAKPGVIIYPLPRKMDLASELGYSVELPLVAEFVTNERSEDGESLEEDIGFLLNELNRDLTLGGTCIRLYCTDVIPFNGDAENEQIAQIHFSVEYRHMTADASQWF
jgi:hypothetical protein